MPFRARRAEQAAGRSYGVLPRLIWSCVVSAPVAAPAAPPIAAPVAGEPAKAPMIAPPAAPIAPPLRARSPVPLPQALRSIRADRLAIATRVMTTSPIVPLGGAGR